MDVESVLLALSSAVAGASLAQAVWAWLKGRNAQKITVRVGDDIIELDSNDPEDAEEILDFAARQRTQVELVVPTKSLQWD